MRLMQRMISGLLVVILVMTIQPSAVLASTQPLPVQLKSVGVEDTVMLPNWEEIALADLPRILTGGSIGTQWNGVVGYDLSRVWSAGDQPETILKLGDLAQSFAPQAFTLGQIRDRTGMDLNTIALSQFPLVGEQTLAQLVEAVPGLGDLPIQDITPVASLLDAQGITTGAESLQDILQDHPFLTDLQLQQIDLSSFSLNAIPQLEDAILRDFDHWQSQFIEQVPGLSQVPLTQMPNSITLVGDTVARIDSIWGAAEGQRSRTISGSYQAGFAVPCGENCAHLELDDLENSGSAVRGNFEGRQWISGKYQTVAGGEGCLQPLNGGVEPTGRHPFGSGFKVVVWETDETTDTSETALFFQLSSFCGDSPYFLGPFPFLNYQRDDLVFLGLVEGTSESTSTSSHTLSQLPSTQLQSQPFVATSPPPSHVQSSSFLPSTPVTKGRPCTADVVEGISLDGLSTALSQVQGKSQDYMKVGEYVCADGSCGRAIGAYQTLTSSSQFQNQVLSNSGAKEWLAKIEQGYTPTPDEMMQFYPPQKQEEVFESAIAPLITQTQQQIDPRTGRFFTGDRLLERVAQKWLGGASSKVDSDYRDPQAQLSLYEYGMQVRQLYNASGGNPICP